MGNLLGKTWIGDEETRDKTDVPHNPEGACYFKFFSHANTTDLLEMEVELDGDADHVDFSLYEYPFENIVFEGGGTKGLAYCGAIQVLEEQGIRPNIKRIAGTSAGAITATLFAVGLSSAEIRELMAINMRTLMMDNRFGYCSLIPNMLRYFGWNPGHRFRSWLDERFEGAGLSKNITFKELLKKRGVELCIVVSNVNLMTTEYFHPKTTPNMSVREAVYMSMAIPLLFQASCYDVYGTGCKDTYVDGGLFCNYPINCFDGWWLSMETEDSFMEKFRDISDLPRMFENSSRFGVYNDRTLGFLLYADKEKDLLRDTLERTRDGTGRGQIPDTKLGRKFMKQMEVNDEQRKTNEELGEALNALLKALKVHADNKNYVFNLEELRRALEDVELKQHKHLLFKQGSAASAEDVMEEMDKDKDGQTEFKEIVAYFGRHGYSLKTRFLGHSRRQVTSLESFLVAIEEALSYNVQRLNVHEDDIKRTVGINTGHVGTTNFEIEAADKNYVVNQGRKTTEVFLKEYVKENNPSRKKPAVKTATETKLKEDVQETTAAPNNDDIRTVEKGTDIVTTIDREAIANAEPTVLKDTESDGERTEGSGSVSDGADTVRDGGKTDRSESLSDRADKGYQSQ